MNILKKILYFSILIASFYGVNVTIAGQVEDKSVLPYAYGIKIENPDAHPVLRFALPKSVYRYVQHANLSDVAMFDKNNQPIPFQIITSQTETDVIRKQVEFYPIFSNTEELPKLSVSMLNTEDGTEVKVDTETNLNRKKIVDYIIPLANLKDENLKELELNWDNSRKNWIAEVSLWVSDDLKKWQHIPQKNMSIANLDFKGKTLLRNIVPIGFTLKNQYLLVRWMGDANEINLKQVYAITSHTKPAMNIYSEVLTHKKLLEKNSFEYQLDGFYPISQINLDFEKPNRLSNAVIFSKLARKASNWQYRGSGFFYLLEKDEQLLYNQPIAIARDTDKLWKVTISDNAIATKPYPSLKVYWVPDSVVFVAEGEGPYTLAFGSAFSNGSQDVAAIQSIFQQYTDQLTDIPQAVVKNLFTISGKAAFKTQVNWRQVMLCAVLVIGTIMVLWMLLILKREISSSPE